MSRLCVIGVTAFALTACGCSTAPSASDATTLQLFLSKASPERIDAFRRARVWSPSNVEAANIRLGPSGPGSFRHLAAVTCDHVDKPLRGHSLKFACDAGGGDVVKVKFGATNGEVYGEVAATRLLWALGFGADRMYPVRVMCRGCPARLGGEPTGSGRLFDPAVIERSMAGSEFDDDPGWSWQELDRIDEQSGGAPVAHRDGLKLLAVFLQHTDNKTEQQRLLCLDEPHARHAERCRRPFLVLDDVGLTFGGANVLNNNAFAGANYRAWSQAPVWTGAKGCVGNLPRSFTGTLGYPSISEEGRQFLADLLLRLSQQQIRDVFEISRFDRRPPSGGDPEAGASIEDWVQAFTQKRDAIVSRRCD